MSIESTVALTSDGDHPDRNKLSALVGVFAAVLLGFLLRMATARNVLADGDLAFYGYDSYYHMRRVLYTIDHFPHTLWSDSYLNYPHGMELMWPPLFDQIIAGTSLLLGADGQRSVEMIGAMVPPILGSLTILALYCLARELFGKRVALLSAVMLAIAPSHVGTSMFGRPDHHVLEGLLLVSVVLFMVLALSGRDHPLRFSVIAGALVAALATAWIGTPAYLGIFLLYAIVQISSDLRDGRSSKEMVCVFAVTFGVALLFLLPFWNDPWLIPSFFSVVGVLLAVPAIYGLSCVFSKKKIPWEAFPLTVATLGYVIVILTYRLDQTTDIYTLLWSGLRYFSGGDLSWRVTEAVPLYAIAEPVSFLGFNLVLALGGLIVLIVRMQHVDLRRGQLLFLVWTLVALILTLVQNRFLYIFNINMAVLISLFFFLVADHIQKNGWIGRYPPATMIATGVVLILVILPSAIDTTMMVQDEPEIAGDWQEALRWLEKNTPVTSYFEEPYEAPEYGILSWWDYGNWILYRSRRPVVANNFQAGAVEAARFYLSEDEEDAMAILKMRGSRYVVTNEKILYGNLPAVVLWIDGNPIDYVNIIDEGNILTFVHTRRFMKTVLAGCHIFDCSGMKHLRLIYESNTTVGLLFPTNKIKIFEQVPGARIAGTADVDVEVSLEMTTNQGRRFRYTSHDKSEDGRYEIIVPYSTEDRYDTRSAGVYQVTSGGVTKEVEVSEDDLIQGRKVVVNF